MTKNCFNCRLEGGHCTANVGCGIENGKRWMTIYLIWTQLEYRRQGEATRLVNALKEFCEKSNSELAAWCPMDERSEGLFKKCGIPVYG